MNAPKVPDSPQYAAGQLVKLKSGGATMVVTLSFIDKNTVGAEMEYAACCWHSGEGHPVATAYPVTVLTAVQ